MEEIESRHRKELKALDGEKRAALKKAKGTKGKKAKEVLAALEAEYDEKLQKLQARHEEELAAAAAAGGGTTAVGKDEATTTTPAATERNAAVVESEEESPSLTPAEEDEARKRKIEKARRKKEKAREAEREREQRIAEETANAGPSSRDLENAVIEEQLGPLGLAISDVTADGHCLYRAVAAQVGDSKSYQEIRQLCAETLLKHADDFAPFCEYTDDVPDFKAYCERVRSSADWGGHLELRALSIALKRPITIYRATSKEPLVIEEQGCTAQNPILLSYHMSYYALGEHYNQVVRL